MNSGIIRNVWICDGSGAEPFKADLRFENGLITGIGTNLSGAVQEYQADGLLLTPGFIDIHAHSDLSLAAAPEAFGKISQGITTEISGNCGLSPFPILTDEVRDHLRKTYSRYNIPITWHDFNSYISAIDHYKPAVNYASFCGYNTLRANFTGYENQPFPENKIREMRNTLSHQLRQGATGLSTGLLYVPGKFAGKKELELIASALKGTGKPISTHLRSEGDQLIEALQEALQIARSADNRLQISHLKTAKPGNWHKLTDAMNLIIAAQKNGISVCADRYPYTHAQTSLSVILPPPFDAMTDAAIMEKLKQSPQIRKDLEAELKSNPPSWERIILCTTSYQPARKFAGESYLNVCRNLSLAPETLCVKLMVEDAPGTMAAFGGMSGENMKKILTAPFVCCGSDETARPGDASLGLSHPRGFGSFPRFFNIVSETCSIGETVRKMSSLPAEICNLSNRGRLKIGCAADLVLLEPETFSDRATFKEPHTPAAGVHSVFVNGFPAFRNGKVLRRAGMALKVI